MQVFFEDYSHSLMLYFQHHKGTTKSGFYQIKVKENTSR